MKKKLRVVVLLIAALLAAAVFIYQRAEDFAGQRLAISQETIFTLPAGTGRTGLEALLTEQKVLAPSPWFAWLLRIEPSLANVKAGTFRFTPGMTVRDMLALLVSGKEAQFALRLIEGLRLQDWLQVMQAAPYLKHQLTGKDEAAIAAYVASGEPMGKAGAYAIQGGAERYIRHLAGSYSGVMGLPLQQTEQLLQAFESKGVAGV